MNGQLLAFLQTKELHERTIFNVFIQIAWTETVKGFVPKDTWTDNF